MPAMPPKPMRKASHAVLVDAAQVERWHATASSTPGLSEIELAVLSAIAVAMPMTGMPWRRRFTVCRGSLISGIAASGTVSPP
jgi:hypothetical protein